MPCTTIANHQTISLSTAQRLLEILAMGFHWAVIPQQGRRSTYSWQEAA